MSLRGHGNSEGHERLLWTSMEDYVNDVAQVVDRMEIHLGLAWFAGSP
jgi:alpha-beta hydrolase superfamily lysophospholipase